MLVFITSLVLCVVFFIAVTIITFKILYAITSSEDLKSEEEITIGSYNEPDRKYIKEYKTGKKYLSKTK